MAIIKQTEENTATGRSAKADAAFEEYGDDAPRFEPVMDEQDAISAVAQTEPVDGGSVAAAEGIESKLETLIPNVLSMAESIVQLAETSGELTAQLRTNAAEFEEIIADYDNILQRKNRHMLGLLGTSVGVIAVCLLLVIFMSLSFSRQVTNMNALSLTLGRRIADVNSGLVTFEELNRSIESLESAVLGVANGIQVQQAAIADMKAKQDAGNLQLMEDVKSVLAKQSTATGAIVGGVQAEVSRSATAVSQSNSVLQSLRLEVVSVGAAVNGLLEMRDSIDALVTLNRERYLEQLGAQEGGTEAEAVQAEPAISFQRELPETAPAQSTP